MSNKIFQKVFDVFSFFSAPQITVISFVVMSLLGGILLYITEYNRQVHAKIPVTKTVLVSEKSLTTGKLVIDPVEEVHTFTQDVSYKGERFIDTLFTAVSALCVTGLTSSDFSSFTLSGQIITMVLIQMGGLGIILFTSIFAMAVARGISEHTNFRKLLSGVLDTREDYVRNMIRHVILYTFLLEGAATVVMGSYLQWSSAGRLIHGINPWWWALFHSVSAFNNAGFGLLNDNLMSFVTDPVINLTIAGLIILGGIGYPVLIGIHVFLRSRVVSKKDSYQHKLLADQRSVAASSVQIRVAIVGTIWLLLFGMMFPFFDFAHRAVFQEYSLPEQLLINFFQSVSTRTAGFNTIDLGSLGSATIVLYIILMFIGANPAGTGGGIKIPTVAVLYGYIKDWFYEPRLPVMLFRRPVSKFAVSHAIRLFFLSMATVAVVTFLILFIEGERLITPDPTFSFIKILFEVVSAFGTVGLTMGFRGGVTSFSAIMAPGAKFLIILTMLIGRLGPLTLLAALPWKRELKEKELTPDYSDAQRIQIG